MSPFEQRVATVSHEDICLRERKFAVACFCDDREARIAALVATLVKAVALDASPAHTHAEGIAALESAREVALRVLEGEEQSP